MKIDKEDFETWRGHPITEALMRACVVWADEAKSHWVQASWDGGRNEDAYLWRMKGQAEAFQELRKLTLEDIEEAINGSEEARRAGSA